MESLPAYATNLSAKGLRYGGTREIQNHINAGSLAAVLRGGWALDEKETYLCQIGITTSTTI